MKSFVSIIGSLNDLPIPFFTNFESIWKMFKAISILLLATANLGVASSDVRLIIVASYLFFFVLLTEYFRSLFS